MEATKKPIPRSFRHNAKRTLIHIGGEQYDRLKAGAGKLTGGNVSELINRWLDDEVTNADLPPKQAVG